MLEWFCIYNWVNIRVRWWSLHGVHRINLLGGMIGWITCDITHHASLSILIYLIDFTLKPIARSQSRDRILYVSGQNHLS